MVYAIQTCLIKYVNAASGGSHQRKISTALECTFVVRGEMRGEVDGKEIVLRAGDYVIIEPGTPNNICIAVSPDLESFTIKAPSTVDNKKVVE